MVVPASDLDRTALLARALSFERVLTDTLE